MSAVGEFYIPKFRSVTIRVEGGMVQFIENGMMILDLPWEAAKKLSRVIRHQAAVAEQNTKVLKVISDQALLIRKGFPIALTNRPDVFKEAGNEAAHNRELRRALPGGVPSGVVFGSAVVRAKPSKHRIGCVGIPSAEKVGNIGGKK